MNATRIALAVAASLIAVSAVAAPTKAGYSLATTPAAATTGGVGTSSGKSWNDTSSSAYGTNGSNYGNSYSWGTATSGNGPAVAMTAWGSTGTSATSTIQKAWIGNYGTSNGFGITSQSPGELNSTNDPDAASPLYQHAIDNTQSYESMMFSFASSVTLNDVSIGFKGGDADATVLAYVGTGDPNATSGASSLSNGTSAGVRTYADLLSSGQWVIAGNLLNMSTSGPNTLSTSIASKYWMVGAYMPIGANSKLGNDTTADQFKITGLSATRAVPEPESLALFGIAGVALLALRRRTTRRV